MGAASAVRDPSVRPVAAGRKGERPVLLLTLDVLLDDAAVAVATDAAMDARCPLVVANGIPLAAGEPASAARRTFGDYVVHERCRAVVADARSAGVEAQYVMYHHPRPVHTACSIAQERGVGLLVLGADRRMLGRVRFALAARRIRREAPCLVWIAG